MVVDEGSYWRVGDGSSIDVWHDKWLSRLPSRKVSSSAVDSDINVVSDLNVNGTNQWNRVLIQDSFIDGDQHAILGIHLARSLLME